MQFLFNHFLNQDNFSFKYNTSSNRTKCTHNFALNSELFMVYKYVYKVNIIAICNISLSLCLLSLKAPENFSVLMTIQHSKIPQYINTQKVSYFFIAICLTLVTYIKLFLCVLTFATYLCAFLLNLFFYNGSKWSNISYQCDGN